MTSFVGVFKSVGRVLPLSIGCVVTLGLTACGGQDSGNDAQGAVDVIGTPVELPSGMFLVRCRYGGMERRSEQDLEADRMCMGGGSGGHRGGGSHGGHDHKPMPRASEAFFCVSRFNNGRSPWRLAKYSSSGKPQTVDVVFETLDQCEMALRESHGIGLPHESTHFLSFAICGSRYDNGRSPWAVFVLTPQLQRKSAAVYGSFESCQAQLANSKRLAREGDIRFICGSRYENGRDPWDVFIMNRTGVNPTSMRISFSDVSSCSRSIAAMRWWEPGKLGFCAPSYHSSRGPYSVYIINVRAVGTIPAAQPTQFVYESLEDCQRVLRQR